MFSVILAGFPSRELAEDFVKWYVRVGGKYFYDYYEAAQPTITNQCAPEKDQKKIDYMVLTIRTGEC